MTTNTTNFAPEAHNQANKKSSKKKYLIAGAAALATLLGGAGAYHFSSKSEKAPEKEKIETPAPETKTPENSATTITLDQAKEQTKSAETPTEKAEKTQNQEKVIDDGRDLSDLPEETEREKEGLSEEVWRESQKTTEKLKQSIRQMEKTYEQWLVSEEIINTDELKKDFCDHFESYSKGLKENGMKKSNHPNVKKAEALYKKLKAQGY